MPVVPLRCSLLTALSTFSQDSEHDQPLGDVYLRLSICMSHLSITFNVVEVLCAEVDSGLRHPSSWLYCRDDLPPVVIGLRAAHRQQHQILTHASSSLIMLWYGTAM